MVDEAKRRSKRNEPAFVQDFDAATNRYTVKTPNATQLKRSTTNGAIAKGQAVESIDNTIRYRPRVKQDVKPSKPKGFYKIMYVFWKWANDEENPLKRELWVCVGGVGETKVIRKFKYPYFNDPAKDGQSLGSEIHGTPLAKIDHTGKGNYELTLVYQVNTGKVSQDTGLPIYFAYYEYFVNGKRRKQVQINQEGANRTYLGNNALLLDDLATTSGLLGFGWYVSAHCDGFTENESGAIFRNPDFDPSKFGVKAWYSQESIYRGDKRSWTSLERFQPKLGRTFTTKYTSATHPLRDGAPNTKKATVTDNAPNGFAAYPFSRTQNAEAVVTRRVNQAKKKAIGTWITRNYESSSSTTGSASISQGFFRKYNVDPRISTFTARFEYATRQIETEAGIKIEPGFDKDDAFSFSGTYPDIQTNTVSLIRHKTLYPDRTAEDKNNLPESERFYKLLEPDTPPSAPKGLWWRDPKWIFEDLQVEVELFGNDFKPQKKIKAWMGRPTNLRQVDRKIQQSPAVYQKTYENYFMLDWSYCP